MGNDDDSVVKERLLLYYILAVMVVVGTLERGNDNEESTFSKKGV